MRSKVLRNLLRALLYAAGAGAGSVAAFLYVQVHDLTSDAPLELWVLILLYVLLGALGMLAAHLLSPRFVSWWNETMLAIETRLESLTTTQLVSMGVWLLGGLLIASLITQILHFLGESMFTMAVSAILYVVLGVLGLSIGARRAEDMASLMAQGRVRKGGKAGMKLLDASILMDGRLVPLMRTGVIDGDVCTADYILAELTEMASSPDHGKRLQGQRALDAAKAIGLQALQTEGPAPVETDVALMALCQEKAATLLTADALMHKAARVAGVKAVNLNDLAMALRSVTAAGDVLSVRLTREGREPGQGVGYLEDGAMLVVEGGADRIGRTVQVTITSVLQTSAGRMAFAKVSE